VLALATGTIILDRYQVAAPRASGDAAGLGALALDRNLGCCVDLVVAPDPAGTPAGDVCARRAHAIAVLQHPALPLGLDMGLHDRRLVLVYQHAEGRSLAEVVAREAGEWTDRRALRLIANLAAALGLAHERGLSHGSFDARSVLVERGGMATIRDLVWPRPVTAVDPADLAPEVRRGQMPDPRADVFALGHLLRRLLSTGAPWSTDGLDGLGNAVRDVVQRAVAEDPRDRYADGAEVARAIERLLSASPRVGASVAAARPHATRPYSLTHGAAAPVSYRPPAAPVSYRPPAAPVSYRPPAAPVSYRPPAAGPKQQRDGLLPVVLGLTVALSLIAGAIGHRHPGDGWRSHGWVSGDGGGVRGTGCPWGPGGEIGPPGGASP